MNIIEKLLSVIAPHNCMLCKAEGDLLCGSCALSLPTLPSICYACGKATANNMPCTEHKLKNRPNQIFIHSEYKGTIKELLREYKFNYKRSASKDIALLLDSILPYYPEPPLVTYVPTIGQHVRTRSFDHCKLIAKELARTRGWLYVNLLYKTKNIQQKGANRAERKKQIKDAIAGMNQKLIKDSHILLVDDVITTGATIEACAEVLYSIGARQVDVVVLARTPAN
jgi:competence protein ComFC